MYATIRTTSTPISTKTASTKLTRAAQSICSNPRPLSFGPRASHLSVHHHARPSHRPFSTTPHTQLEYFPPPKNAPSIKLTGPAWPHPVYTEEQMNAIKIAHRATKTWSDWIALAMVRVLRFGMDTATRYKHDHSVSVGTKDPKDARVTTYRSPMTERKWLVRFVFLESVAGVPGMVAGMLRHLHSLRRMQRDNGWIETLLEEAYNERMHLLTFLKMAEPGWFMRMMILAAQGTFFNTLFVAYLVSPRTVHRFVGYIEEEAVITYTRAIADIDAGKLPLFAAASAPEIAVRYWNMPEGKRGMRDLLLYIRADEAKHREVNHTLGNLEQRADPNPFVSEYKEGAEGRPGKGIENIKPVGWEREEVV